MGRVIAFFQPGWADWEAGPVLAMLREAGRFAVTVLTPDGGPQTSIGGVRAAADGAFGEVGPTDAEVFLVIGSDAWPEWRDQRFFDLLSAALSADRIVGAICAGTVAAARAGLFAGRAHTSNGGAWLARHAPNYPGADHYVDTPRAVTAGKLVSAPGSAPQTFCSAILRLAEPEQASLIADNDALMAREWIV